MYKVLINELQEIKSLIRGNNSNNWMSIKEVSQYASVSESTIRRAIAKGELKVSKKIGKLLFKLSKIDRWLNG